MEIWYTLHGSFVHLVFFICMAFERIRHAFTLTFVVASGVICGSSTFGNDISLHSASLVLLGTLSDLVVDPQRNEPSFHALLLLFRCFLQKKRKKQRGDQSPSQKFKGSCFKGCYIHPVVDRTIKQFQQAKKD